jgi:hypothetical protein
MVVQNGTFYHFIKQAMASSSKGHYIALLMLLMIRQQSGRRCRLSAVSDFFLRLHVHDELCYKKLGDDQESISNYEEDDKIMRTASKVHGASKWFMIPIISPLCALQMRWIQKTKAPRGKRIEGFVT